MPTTVRTVNCQSVIFVRVVLMEIPKGHLLSNETLFSKLEIRERDLLRTTLPVNSFFGEEIIKKKALMT